MSQLLTQFMDPRIAALVVCMCALPTAPASLAPAALDSFMAIATGSRSITFTWCPQSAESGATPIDYLLSCETDSCQTDSCGTDSCPPVNESTIQGQSRVKYDCFMPNTTYTCYLSTIDDNGTVGPNETCTVQTLEDVPSAPTVVNITVLSPNEILVDWIPPDYENGGITHYNVYINYSSKAVSYSAAGTSLNVTNLPSSVSITVRVSASTRVGEGELSHPIIVTTLETAPNAPWISSVERANTSLYLNWTAVNSGGYIARYIVTYKPLYTTECQTDTEEVDLSSDPIPPGVNHTVQKVIHGLDPNVSYSVTIIAYNSAGKPGENDTQKLVPPWIPPSYGSSSSSQKSTIQLRLSSARSCLEWREQNGANDISIALTEQLHLICPNCMEQGGILLTNFTLWCMGNRNQALFRATLASCPCQQCRACFEFWLSISTPFLRLTNQILLADTTCPPYADSLNSSSCMSQETSLNMSCTHTNSSNCSFNCSSCMQTKSFNCSSCMQTNSFNCSSCTQTNSFNNSSCTQTTSVSLIFGCLLGGVFIGVSASILVFLAVVFIRKYKLFQHGKVRDEATPAPVRYKPDPRENVKGGDSGYEPIYFPGETTKDAATAATAIDKNLLHSSQNSTSRDSDYEIPSLVIAPKVQSKDKKVVRTPKVEYDIPEAVETAISEPPKVGKKKPARSISATACGKDTVSVSGTVRGKDTVSVSATVRGKDTVSVAKVATTQDQKITSATRRARQSEAEQATGSSAVATSTSSLQEQPLPQKPLLKKKPLLPNKAAIVQAKTHTTAPPQKAVVRPPTVRPKPKGKAAKDIPTDPNMAYRAIKHDIDNLYT